MHNIPYLEYKTLCWSSRDTNTLQRLISLWCFTVFELDEASKELCTIIIPFGKYQYNCLSMRVKVCPDISQSMIMKIMDGLGIEHTSMIWVYGQRLCLTNIYGIHDYDWGNELLPESQKSI